MKDKYIKYAEETFKGPAKDIALNQIKHFYNQISNLTKTEYKIGDSVFLKKGTFIHGIPFSIERFDWALENGFISSDFSKEVTTNKYFNTIGMWNIQEDCILSDYIRGYSGVTIEYTEGRGPGSDRITKLVPYQEFEKEIEATRNSDFWMWRAEQTKEIRFLPSYASDRRQLAFILNMESEYAKKFLEADIFNNKMTKEILKYFVVESVLDKFMNVKRDDFTTNRESAIIFGIPSVLIEGVLVGRVLEKETDTLEYISSKIPGCYICNLDGKVIIANKN